MKYIKTYKLFEDIETSSIIEYPNFKNLKFDINYDKISNCEFIYYENKITYKIKFNIHSIGYDKLKGSDILTQYDIGYNIKYYKGDVDFLFFTIIDSCLKNLDSIINIINDMLDEINTIQKDLLSRYNPNNMNERMKIYVKFKDEIENSYKYQKFLYDNGDIERLLKLPKLNTIIDNKMNDIKKQTEWS